MTSQDRETPIAIEEIKVSFTARSKGPRYYSEPEIRHRLQNPEGQFFYQPARDSYLLRTTRGKGSHERLIIIFALNESNKRLTVITQTSDHYDWSQYTHVSEQPYRIGGDKE